MHVGCAVLVFLRIFLSNGCNFLLSNIKTGKTFIYKSTCKVNLSKGLKMVSVSVTNDLSVMCSVT